MTATAVASRGTPSQSKPALTRRPPVVGIPVDKTDPAPDPPAGRGQERRDRGPATPPSGLRPPQARRRALRRVYDIDAPGARG